MTTDNLPPLPQPEFDNLLDHIYEYGTSAEGTIPRARALCEAYARAAVLAERERCAKVCEEVAAPAENTERTIWWNTAVHQCAAAIREGGK